jgi:hypothetical protein
LEELTFRNVPFPEELTSKSTDPLGHPAILARARIESLYKGLVPVIRIARQ